MASLRLVLVLGLVTHKLIWEILKTGDRVRPLRSSPPSASKRIVKSAKGAALFFIVFQTLFLNLFPILQDARRIRVVGTSLFLVGLVTAIVGRVQLGKNWADIEDRQVLPQQSLVANGIYRYIRHPIYIGDALLLIGLELALNSWLVLAMVVPLFVFVRQSLVEEQLLARAFPEYKEYRERTKRFIPFLI
ncbi:MAG TPA: isoprenylcysteine carboxylmethyltransferase family protein [Anaerolineae bacterium]|nr:isoprenylcysteine carboxylmethyltransferase family protein [Anaerolineae bacterium]